MPLYEYRCKKCGHTFEKIQSFSSPDERECPVCGSEVERLISAPAIQFKGAGWYVNDYAGKSKPKSAGESTASADKPASSDGAKSSSDSASLAANSSGSSSGAGSTTTASKGD